MIWTFVNTPNQVDCAITAGAHGLILEHSRTSIRSCVEDTVTVDDKLAQMIHCIAQRIPSERLSFNIDLISHSGDFSTIETAVRAAARYGIREFRVQDLGVIPFIKGIVPDSVCLFSPEIGFHSESAIRLAMTQTDRLCISNEVSFPTLTGLQALLNRVEVQVQGPILIQYSARRYLHGAIRDQSTYLMDAADLDYPGRKVRFWDSPNGTAMFLYFDRCLLRELDRLNALQLGRWLVDCRGQSDAVLELAVRAYSSAWRHESVDVSGTVSQLALLTGHAQRPGFFNGNNTDQDRNKVHGDVIGVIRDLVKDRYVVIEMRANLNRFPNRCRFSTTKGDVLERDLQSPRDAVTLEPVTSVGVGDLIVADWIKGVTTKSSVFLITTD